MEQVIEFFKEQGIYNENFFTYIKDKVKVLPYDVSLAWFGCFPILANNIIVDIRVSVPEIVTEKNLLVNLHEFYHAYEIYNELGKVYVPNIEEREKAASDFENSYLLSKKKTK
jgi:hypothetical protein